MIYIGVLNKSNLKQFDQIQHKEDCLTVILSNINFFDFDPNVFDLLKTNNVILIPSKDNIKSANKNKKSKKYTLFVDFILKCNQETKLLLNNDALLYVSNNDLDWHQGYDGKLGYAVSLHNSSQDLIYYSYAASFNGNQEKLLLKQFDGRFLQEIK
jgi:hypothetical protein